MNTRVTSADLRTIAVREDENSAIVAAWAQPDTALLMSVLTTHGPQAVAFVEGMADYYLSREAFGTVHAKNYATTAGSLRSADQAYGNTDQASATSLGSTAV